MAKITREMIEQLRMPNEYRPPQGVTNPFMMAGGMGMPGRGAQQSEFVDPQGMVDPEALRAMAWGTDYDVEARRNAIAARLAANQAAQAGSQSGGGRSADAAMYGPGFMRNPSSDAGSPLVGLMGVNPETGPTFF